MASGAECQCEVSCCASSPPFWTLGKSRSSVDESIDCLASSTDPERFEVRRGLARSAAKVAARPRGRRRRGDMLFLAVEVVIVPLALSGGLESSLTTMTMVEREAVPQEKEHTAEGVLVGQS